MRSFSLFFLCLLFTGSLFAQAEVPNTSQLSIEQIMQGSKFVGESPSGIFWDNASETIYFNWNPDQDTLSSLYKISLDDRTPNQVSLAEQAQLMTGGTYNSDRSQKVMSENGDLFLLDMESQTFTQLTNTISRESNPQFTADDQGILYVSDNNLFYWDLSSGRLEQLTNITDRSPRRGGGSQSEQKEWLEDQQMELFEVLRQRAAEEEARQERREALEVERPAPIYIGDDFVYGHTASPDLRFITFVKVQSANGDNTKVPNYVTESGYIEDIRARVKVGSPQSTYELVVYDRERDTSYTLDTKQIEGIYDKPDFLREYHEGEEPFEDQYEDPREVFVNPPIFSDDGKAIIVIRAQDNKDRWIMQLMPESGELKLVDRQRDEAWIAGPGIGWSRSSGNIGWMPDNEHIWYQSEKTGFSNLYLENVETGAVRPLAPGEYEILDAELSADGTTFFVTANAEGPHEHHFYHLSVESGELEKITDQAGNHEVTMSPDEKYLAIRYSYSNRPWELFLMENKAGAEMQQITESTTADFEAYSWRDPEIVRFTAGDGAQVAARLYRPQRAKRNGPAVIFVHGAGYLQNVHKWWSSYYREYMFHNLLVDNGYTVLDIDYRGSAGYGRDWRTGIYRHMGGKDLSDQVDGAKFLVEEYNIDPDKIGIYGGSYGGFITLMGLFNYPGTFTSGAALRSVTDWAHYNHGYTSNILNTPVEDPKAFRQSSPIYFAEGLEDNLLILHGMIDDNVQFQDVVRLAQRLIELGKDHWEFAVFPVERHGFVEPSSWTDEYKRIFKLFQTTLK
jgi:dipeptidyl aminopeptidase/acylaminoacyl peptidase